MTPVCPRRHTHTHWRQGENEILFLAHSFSERLGKVGSRLTSPLDAKINRKVTNTHRAAATAPGFSIDLPCRAESRPGNDPITRSSLRLSAGWVFAVRDEAYCSTFMKERANVPAASHLPALQLKKKKVNQCVYMCMAPDCCVLWDSPISSFIFLNYFFNCSL